ncbi:alpha-1,4-digalacturonate transport system permease protein [Friedmanniella endophytica]|uniref:Alpha-1,4-digalacturonate transport system permease protein n=1 Tax=Microlunatus kandeliicorticis TaxID=1759536 RepID=A0A7W3P6L3_9ACTN|nr:sugar ABC transporter permease [Microlunatus kandeliicorticis]MBA8795072.1 alpha-1,4-digalacturonate transport system permease protein [Microlunatus kandeliicorticis]
MATQTVEPAGLTRGSRPAPGPARARRPRRGPIAAPLLFIAPAVVLFCLFFVWPGALGVYYSFTSYTGVGTPRPVGLDNYARLFGDRDFYAALSRTVVYTVLAVPMQYLVSLAVAVLLVNRHARGTTVARVVFFFPWLISPIVTGVVWRWLFGENFGFVNFVIDQLHGTPQRWETNANLSLAVVLFASAWGGTAFNMLLFIAALRNIPRSYLEAASIDGATGWQRFRWITWPLLAPTTFLVVLLTTIGSMKEFAMIQALNGGGPGTSNMLLVQYIYRTGFERAKIGYASAASFVLMIILLVIALVQKRFDKAES